MKKINKKGFTLVELAIVIAVIAILAAVLIFTFASVLRKANDSARVQQIKNEEIAQKADDIIKKIDDSKWFGWEDFEADIVEKITKAVKNDTDEFTKEDLEKVVKDAVTTAIANVTINNSDLTEDQIKAIVENALGTLKYEGVTEAQVRAIVSASEANVRGSQLTAAQVRLIVNAANDNNLTAAQVAEIVGRANFITPNDVQAAVTTITAALTNVTSDLATSAQAEEIKELIENITTTIATNDLDDVVLAKGLNIKLAKSNKAIVTPSDAVEAINQPNPVYGVSSINLVLFDLENATFLVVKANVDTETGCHEVVYADNIAAGDPLYNPYKYWTFETVTSNPKTYSEFSVYLLDGSTVKTVNLTGVGLDVGNNEVDEITYTGATDSREVLINTNGGILNINAQNDNVIHYGSLDELNIIAVANMSYHEYGNVIFASIKTGHVSFEENSSIKAVHIIANDDDIFDPIIISYKENVEQPDYSRDYCEIDEGGTKVCTLALPEETNNIILFKQGIYEQIKLQPTTVEIEGTGSTSDESKIWITEDLNATNETKVASDQLANIFGNRTSALVEVEGQDTPVLDNDKDLTPEQEAAVVADKPSVEEKKNEIFASVYVRAQVDDILDISTIKYDLWAYYDYTGSAYIDKAYLFKGFTDEEFILMEKFISAKDENGDDIFNINNIDIESLNKENISKALTSVENSYGAETRKAIEKIINQKSPYFGWRCDFEISFDKEIKAGSVALAGHYGAFADNYNDGEWLGFGLPNITPDQEPIGLLNAMFGVTNNSDFHMPYIAVLAIVQQFSCGVTNLDNDNIGTTITVELCIYNYDEYDNLTERIVCGRYQYTLGAVSTANAELIASHNN